MTWFIGIASFVAGGIAVWFTKDSILQKWHGAEDFAQRLRDKANAVLKAARG